MNKLKLTISPPSKIGDVSIKLNAESFERLAAHFGFFNPDFLKSLRAAERDYRNKKIRKVPCVVRSDGTAGGYNRGIERKKEILKMEGVDCV